MEQPKKPKKAAKPKKPPEPHFQVCVDLFFKFCRENFGTKPSFDLSAPRDLKQILISLRERAEEKNVEWTEEECCRRFLKFLSECKKDSFLGGAFILCNINRQKDKIFFQIAKQATGGNTKTHRTGNNSSPSLGEALAGY